MNLEQYLAYFNSILNQPEPEAPYNNADYYNYAQLNWSRMNRWLKTGQLTSETISKINSIQEVQNWLIITEPWCGDAAHAVPFLAKIASLNPLIKVDYQLRDKEPYAINSYLTNGGKSIPKLIIRDASENDLATWGPRPKECQLLRNELLAQNTDAESLKIALQKWYNQNEGRSIQEEISALVTLFLVEK